MSGEVELAQTMGDVYLREKRRRTQLEAYLWYIIDAADRSDAALYDAVRKVQAKEEGWDK